MLSGKSSGSRACGVSTALAGPSPCAPSFLFLGFYLNNHSIHNRSPGNFYKMAAKAKLHLTESLGRDGSYDDTSAPPSLAIGAELVSADAGLAQAAPSGLSAAGL